MNSLSALQIGREVQCRANNNGAAIIREVSLTEIEVAFDGKLVTVILPDDSARELSLNDFSVRYVEPALDAANISYEPLADSK